MRRFINFLKRNNEIITVILSVVSLALAAVQLNQIQTIKDFDVLIRKQDDQLAMLIHQNEKTDSLISLMRKQDSMANEQLKIFQKEQLDRFESQNITNRKDATSLFTTAKELMIFCANMDTEIVDIETMKKRYITITNFLKQEKDNKYLVRSKKLHEDWIYGFERAKVKFLALSQSNFSITEKKELQESGKQEFIQLTSDVMRYCTRLLY